MTGPGRTVARSVTYLAAVFAVFVGVLMVAARAGVAPRAVADDVPARGQLRDPWREGLRRRGVPAGEQDVWIEDGRIRRVGEGLDLPEDLLRVDGRGRTLVPGLIDGHVHTYGSTLNDALRFGVTTVLDHFMDPGLAASKRPAREELARSDEADLFSAGMLATVAGGHGTQYGVTVDTPSGPDDAPPGSGHARRRGPTESRSYARMAAPSAWISQRSTTRQSMPS